MKAIRRTVLVCTVALVLVAVPTALAAAKELGSVTITGPGIDGELTISDPQGLTQLQQMGFFDTSTLLKVPMELGEGYHLTAYLNMDGKVVPFVEAIYYPAPASQTSYMHFIGAYDGNGMQATKVDRWGAITPAAGSVFAKLAAAQGLTLKQAVSAPAAKAPAAQPQQASAPAAPTARADMRLVPAISAALLLVLAALLAWRRKAVNQGSSQ